MTLVDTSAWVELLRATGTRTDERLRELVSSRSAIATTDPVGMELLAGVSHGRQIRRVMSLLSACENLPVRSEDWRSAASIYRTCRRFGSAPRSQIDCLVAAVALRAELPLLARDRDFAQLAEFTPLELA